MNIKKDSEIMKRIVLMTLCSVFAFLFVSCGKGENDNVRLDGSVWHGTAPFTYPYEDYSSTGEYTVSFTDSINGVFLILVEDYYENYGVVMPFTYTFDGEKVILNLQVDDYLLEKSIKNGKNKRMPAKANFTATATCKDGTLYVKLPFIDWVMEAQTVQMTRVKLHDCSPLDGTIWEYDFYDTEKGEIQTHYKYTLTFQSDSKAVLDMECSDTEGYSEHISTPMTYSYCNGVGLFEAEDIVTGEIIHAGFYTPTANELYFVAAEVGFVFEKR